MNDLSVIETKLFNEVDCNIYSDSCGEYFMTREQVCSALGMVGINSICAVHKRNADRLDKLSTKASITKMEGNRMVTRTVICYSLRGVMEICRLSRMPKADAFMDFVWNTMESLYRGDTVIATPDASITVAPEAFEVRLNQMLGMQQKMLNEQIQTRKVLSQIGALLSSIGCEHECIPAVEAKIEVEPRKVSANAWSEWEKEIFNKCAMIAERENDMTGRDILASYYERMKREYGFVKEQLFKENARSHSGTNVHARLLSLIEHDKTWRSILENMVNAEYSQATSDVQSQVVIDIPVELQHVDEKPVIKSSSTIMNHEQKEQKAEEHNAVADVFHDCILRVGRKFGSDTFCPGYTRRIYKLMMPESEWYEHVEKFARHNPDKKATRQAVVMDSPALMMRFIAATEKIVGGEVG